MIGLFKSQTPGDKPGEAGNRSAAGAKDTFEFTTWRTLCQASPSRLRVDETEEIVRAFSVTVRRLISLATQGLELAKTDSEWVRFFKLRYALYRLILGGD